MKKTYLTPNIKLLSSLLKVDILGFDVASTTTIPVDPNNSVDPDDPNTEFLAPKTDVWE